MASSMDIDTASGTGASAASSSEAAAYAFLDSLPLASYPSVLRPYFPRFKTLRSKKLWYQLTLSIEELIALPESRLPEVKDAKGRQLLIGLYDDFVSAFGPSKLSPLRWVGIAVNVARQYPEPAQALAFLTDSVVAKTESGRRELEEDAEAKAKAKEGEAAAAKDGKEKEKEKAKDGASSSQQQQQQQGQARDDDDAYVFATMEAAHFKLILGDLEGTKAAMTRSARVLDTFDSVEHAVHAAYYRVSGDYYKAKAEYASYYKNSLLFLACVNIETDLGVEDRVQRAHDLSVSALLGDTIYNFGELLLHPILDSLNDTPHAWLSDLLFAFNAGDLGRFEALLPHLSSRDPLLASQTQFLRQKVCLMALIESVFKRSTDDRTLSFETIALETRLPVDEVEHLVMKALSLNLIRGTLDQHAQLARITWVQPRVLDRRQIEALQDRLNQWCTRVQSVAEFVKGQTPELFVTA
ncbi:26S proteasome regulatory subunit [Tilletia horrida]|nr:26S proteasome regulatory subunit [Tilletia horrida]